MTAGLRRFTRGGEPTGARGPDGPDERCELCAAGLGDRHGHVVALDRRALLCTCRACALLFTRQGAAGGRFRTVPDRYLHDPVDGLTEAEWNDLGIPVTTAFLVADGEIGRVVAGYPSAAGVTESLPDPAAWERLRAAHPLLAAPEPDVEAIYVTRASPGAPGLAAFLVPIDACYALAGEVRTRWQGLGGGEAVRRALDAFLDDLRRRSRTPGGRP